MTTTANASTKVANYSASQVAIATAAIVANGGIAEKSVAETLAADPRMNVDDGKGAARTVRSIVAKLRKIVDDNKDTMTYKRVQPTTKSGDPVTNKAALVKSISEASGIAAAKLDGLDKAPKLALQMLAAFAVESAERTGTDD